MKDAIKDNCLITKEEKAQIRDRQFIVLLYKGALFCQFCDFLLLFLYKKGI